MTMMNDWSGTKNNPGLPGNYKLQTPGTVGQNVKVCPFVFIKQGSE